ncbi:MAG: hypothetical protein ACRDPO_17435 [Streptosporangiaceae bacterium]
MSAAAAESAPAAGLPRSYLVWQGGAIVSQVGDAALYFALGWAASAHGGPAAALVLTGINLPRSVLLLAGGAVGDRLGARRVMITGDGVMLAVAAILAVVRALGHAAGAADGDGGDHRHGQRVLLSVIRVDAPPAGRR